MIRRIENCIDEEVKKIQKIYSDFSGCLFDTDNQFETIADHQKLSDQIKDQMCSIFDLLDQLLYTIENWSANHNHLREHITYKRLGNHLVVLKRLLSKYRGILDHVSMRGDFGIKSVNTRTKLTKAIEQLNLSSALISEQPYVKGLNMFTVEQEPIFRIKTDEIRFTLVNYSDLDLDILNVKLVEENHLNSFRTDDLLSNLSLIDGPRDLEFASYSELSAMSNGETINRIEWVATNRARNQKRFKIRIVYLMTGHGKSVPPTPIKYRFLIVGQFRNQMTESQFYTDKFCLLQDTDGPEMTGSGELSTRHLHYDLQTFRLVAATNGILDELPVESDANLQAEPEYDKIGYAAASNYCPEFSNPFTKKDNSLVDLMQTSKTMKLDADQYNESSFFDDWSTASTSSNSPAERRSRFARQSVGSKFDGFEKATNQAIDEGKENEDIRLKLDHCIRKITMKFNQKNDKSFSSFEFNRLERSTLKERLVHSGNFHLPVDQLLNKELNYHCFSFNTFFKHASLCYHNLADDRLRPQIYGLLNRDRIVRLLRGAAEGSYLITFNQSVLSTLTLNYLEHNQLVELLFFEPNLRDDDLNAYLAANKQHLKHPIIKSKF